MELAFDTKRLRDICENKSIASRCLGENVVKYLYARLADLRAAKNIEELPVGSPTLIDNGKISINLIDGYKMIFCSNHTNSATVDLKEISYIKILEIKNYDCSK